MEIILVRHPETEANIQNLFYSKMDYPYTDRGQIEFKNIMNNLESKYTISESSLIDFKKP